MLTPQEVLHATCIHEAGHAVAAVGVGAIVTHAEVSPLNEQGQFKHCRLGNVKIASEIPSLHDGVIIGLAGPVAQNPNITLSELLAQYNWTPAHDIAIVAREVRAYFICGESAIAGSQRARLIDERVNLYLSQSLDRVRHWLTLEPQKAAVRAVSNALKEAARSDGIVGGDMIRSLCEVSGVEHRPALLLPAELPDRL